MLTITAYAKDGSKLSQTTHESETEAKETGRALAKDHRATMPEFLKVEVADIWKQGCVTRKNVLAVFFGTEPTLVYDSEGMFQGFIDHQDRWHSDMPKLGRRIVPSRHDFLADWLEGNRS